MRLYQQIRASIARSAVAGAGLVGVGECAFFVAEELAFEERLSEGSAVDDDKRVLATAASEVDRAGDNLFSSAILAEKKDREVGVGNAVDRRAECLNRGALADQQVFLRRLFDELFVAGNEFGKLLPVRERDGGVRGQLHEAALIVRREWAVVLVQQLEGTDACAIGCYQGDAEECLRVVAGLAVDCAVDFVIIARTDSRAVEGVEAAVRRARAYREAGADVIFPEAPQSRDELAHFAREIGGLLLANMTEFGKTPLVPAAELERMGYRLVIYPVTGLRVAHRAMQELFAQIKQTGSQEAWLDRMAHRRELYELVGLPAIHAAERRFGS